MDILTAKPDTCLIFEQVFDQRMLSEGLTLLLAEVNSTWQGGQQGTGKGMAKRDGKPDFSGNREHQRSHDPNKIGGTRKQRSYSFN